MQQKEQLIWAVEVDLIKDFQCSHLSLLRRYGWLMWMKMQYIHWSATTLTSRVNNIGYLVSMQRSSGETFGAIGPLDMNHPPIATAIPNVGRLPLGHFALTHHKSCSGMSGGTWRRALVSTSPTNSPRSQLDQASVEPAGSSLIYGGSCSHPTGSATNVLLPDIIGHLQKVLCPSLNRSEPSPINCGATMDQNPNPSIRRLIRVASGWIWGPGWRLQLFISFHVSCLSRDVVSQRPLSYLDDRCHRAVPWIWRLYLACSKCLAVWCM